MIRVRSRGSATVELVLLTPVLMLFTVLAAQVGRDADAAAMVRLAADHAARSASMVRRTAMVSVAQVAANDVLQSRGAHCDDPKVAVAVTDVDVAVEVTCRTGRGVATARSVEVIDRYRGEE